jgi:hypothetical protein
VDIVGENGFSVLVTGTVRSLCRFVVAAVQMWNAEIKSKAPAIPNEKKDSVAFHQNI